MLQQIDRCTLHCGAGDKEISYELTELLRVPKNRKHPTPHVVAQREAGEVMGRYFPKDRKAAFRQRVAPTIVAVLRARGIRISRRRVYQLVRFAEAFSRADIERFPRLSLEHFLAVLSVKDSQARLHLLSEAKKVTNLQRKVRETRQAAKDSSCDQCLILALQQS